MSGALTPDAVAVAVILGVAAALICGECWRHADDEARRREEEGEHDFD